MKHLKKVLALGLAFALTLGLFNAPAANAATNPPVAKDKKVAFTSLIGTAGSMSHSTQAISGKYIFEASGDILYKLDKTTGKTVATTKLTAAITCTDWKNWQDNYCALTIGGSSIFVPILGGKIQAVDMTTMKSLWVSQAVPDYANDAATVYDNGYLYGTLNNINDGTGIVYSIKTTDDDVNNATETKAFTWKTDSTKGHYWSTPLINGNTLVVGDEGGNVSAYNKLSGVLINTKALSGKIRSGIAYSQQNECYYVVSNDAVLYKLALDTDNKFCILKKVSLKTNSGTAYNCSSTPVIYNNTIFALSSFDNKSTIVNVLDLNLKGLRQTVTDKGATNATPTMAVVNGATYLYFTLNNQAGGVYALNLSAKTSQIETVYEPSFTGAGNFCMDSVLIDNGNLYFTNDSCNAYSIISTPAKVTSLKYTKAKKWVKKKKSVKLTWKKATNAEKYQISYKKSTWKSYKTLKTTTKTSYTHKLSKGTYYVKVRAYKAFVSNHYGAYSTVKKVTVK
jgi:hypothetical protein